MDGPPEVLPEVSAAAAVRLRQLLDGVRSARGTPDVTEWRSLLLEWLALASDAGRRVPPEFIVPLLDHEDIAMWFVDLRVVAGERGRWLARENHRWADRLRVPPQGDPAVALLQRPEGDGPRALEAIRAVDPGRGRELLTAVWSETGRSAFRCLWALRTGLGPDDEPFLESQRASGMKALEMEAEELLWLLPGSAFARQVRASAWAMVRITRSAAGVAVAVSGDPSPIELIEAVSWTWPADWPPDVLQAVAHTERANDILSGIMTSALRFRPGDLPPGYRELTRALIELVVVAPTFRYRPTLDDALTLLRNLPEHEAEELVVEQLRERPKLGLCLGFNLGGVWNVRWSPRRSAAYLRTLAELPPEDALGRSGNWLGIRTFALNADTALLDDARPVLTALAAREPAIAGEVRWALDILHTRRLMREEIAEQA